MGYKCIDTISTGNSGIGAIPNDALMPVLGCPSGVPCAKECYARKAACQYEATRALWTSNLVHLDVHLDKVEKFIAKHKPSRFRWHVAGDIQDKGHLERMSNIARKNPTTSFACFTKNHAILPDRKALPANFHVYWSIWPGWSNHLTARGKGYPVAWMQDGTESRVPYSARVCRKPCTDCGHCFDRESDVVFFRH